MTNPFAPKQEMKSRATLAMIFLVCVALVTTSTWLIAARSWQARSPALAALVVLAVAAVYLLTNPAKRLFKG